MLLIWIPNIWLWIGTIHSIILTEWKDCNTRFLYKFFLLNYGLLLFVSEHHVHKMKYKFSQITYIFFEIFYIYHCMYCLYRYFWIFYILQHGSSIIHSWLPTTFLHLRKLYKCICLNIYFCLVHSKYCFCPKTIEVLNLYSFLKIKSAVNII